MFAPCNACPVEFPDSSGTPLGIQQSGPISLGPAPWNLYPARNVDTNCHIEVECFNLLKPDGTVSLGICNSNMRFIKKLHQRSVRGAFLCLFCRMTLAFKQENRK
jgi:hypothetical protein